MGDAAVRSTHHRRGSEPATQLNIDHRSDIIKHDDPVTITVIKHPPHDHNFRAYYELVDNAIDHYVNHDPGTNHHHHDEHGSTLYHDHDGSPTHYHGHNDLYGGNFANIYHLYGPANHNHGSHGFVHYDYNYDNPLNFVHHHHSPDNHVRYHNHPGTPNHDHDNLSPAGTLSDDHHNDHRADDNHSHNHPPK